MLRWARKHGCPWNAVECVSAATDNGHLELARREIPHILRGILCEVARFIFLGMALVRGTRRA